MANYGPLLAFITIGICLTGQTDSAPYYGKLIGKLSELHHGVSGEVYAVDGRTLYIKDFTYDGQGPAAYFYASHQKAADKNGFRLRDENGNGEVIRRYRKEGITLTLPDGKNLNNVKIFYLWCEEFDVNFGDVKVPRNFDYPKPQKIDALKGVHAVSSDNVVIVDAQTLLIPNFSYDGEAPDAKFWVGRGAKPSPQGIRVPDENGKETPLRKYDRKTVVLTLPGDLTIFDIGHFGIWCEAFTVDFGHVLIPQDLNIPPSLKMLGVSPQSKLNCEVLYDDLAFEVRWAIAGESIVIQLVAKLDAGEYMSFGLSGDDSKSVMIGGDVVVAWVDKETLKGYAEDYYLKDQSQCSGPTGSCPDNRLQENTNSVRLLNSAMVNGYSIVTYQRPLHASDSLDHPIYTNRSQAVLWAIGPLNQRNEVSFHSHFLKRNLLINFGRPAKWNCPMPESDQSSMLPVHTEPKHKEEEIEEPVVVTTTSAPSRNNVRRRGGNRRQQQQQLENTYEAEQESASVIREQQQPQQKRRGSQRVNHAKPVPTPAPVKKRDAWEIPPIQCYEPEDGVFYAQMGPTGGKRGYPSITGHVGWGISWYINGLLIPELNVVRGKTYTFVVEGGSDPEVSAKYHPFYITDDSVGGYAYKTDEEKEAVRIFAGGKKGKDGSVVPTGVGRLCHWTHTGDSDAEDFESFGAYQRTLELKCDQGEPGVIEWTPDKDTPDTVYYQCFTHRYLGWKINVHDSCDEQPAASNLEPAIAQAPEGFLDNLEVDLEESPSIQIETRVKANDIISVDNGDKESKYVLSEKKIVEFQNLPSPTPEQAEEHSQAPVSHFNTQQPTLLDHPHQQQPNPHYFRSNSSLENSFESTTIFSSGTNRTNDETALVDNTTTFETYELPLIPPPQTPPIFMNDLMILRPNIPHAYPKRATPNTNFNSHNMRPIRAKPSKKYYPRPPYQNYRPYNFELDRPMAYPSRQRPGPLMSSSGPMKSRMPQKSNKTGFGVLNEVKNVEISPLQASTEREPEIQTASYTHIDNTPIFRRPAINTGFKPSSIKLESGFKPIITKEIQDRMDQSDEEVDIEDKGETGVTDKDNENNYEYKPVHDFEPMFVPSPTDKFVKEKFPKITKRPPGKKVQHFIEIIIKRPRSLNETEDELEAEAAERSETYYLPPKGQVPIDVVREPSNIDIESPESDLNIDSPPDVVVTYDGKKVSGQSLTAKISDRPSAFESRISKASTFIKARPQFVKYTGELPPLNPESLFGGVPQQNVGVLSRELDTPALPSVGNGGASSTKLSRVSRV